MIPEEIARRERLKLIRDAGIDPYPADSGRTHLIHEVLLKFDDLETSADPVTIAGRMRSKRKHGGVTFITLEDASGRMQVVLHRDSIGAEEYQAFHDRSDVGDFFDFTGPVFKTQKGEQSINTVSYKILTKSLLPLPEKWHGLTDTEKRYRKRYLDFIANPEAIVFAKARANMVRAIRTFLEDEGFMEVETPILQPIPGGANAKPFVTHHNSLHADFYLRIAPELYLKRLLVGGFEKVFEFARCFRNEGISPQHNPEFTQVETYWAYATIEQLTDHLERMFVTALKAVTGGNKLMIDGKEFTINIPLPRHTFHDVVQKESGIDLDNFTDEASLRTEISNRNINTKDVVGYGDLIDHLYKKLVRPKLIEPQFVIDYPSAMKPLAKRREGGQYSASSQLLINGSEVLNSFNELNDPLEQEERFQEQDALRERGSDEAQHADYDYVTALKHGMPPAAGYGIGIDRLAMLLAGVQNLKEVILFPTLKPVEDEETNDDSE
ncbi:MAG: lysine--tRNA ligase [Candidatus Uhrbacteria bacterium]|nr:lysine--tRNA ligase [Candidatus Uhrbacteria bacterium]